MYKKKCACTKQEGHWYTGGRCGPNPNIDVQEVIYLLAGFVLGQDCFSVDANMIAKERR